MILTKNSNSSEIKQYFLHILELKNSHEEFPVDLDEVWTLVYTRKDSAVKDLTKNFIQDIDYQVFRQKAEQNGSGGHNKITYKLSVSCLEYFIARKIRAVFNVYRAVFHQKIERQLDLSDPNNVLRIVQNWKEEHDKRLLLEQQNAHHIETIKEQAPKVLFANAVEGSQSSCLVGELAKILRQNGVDIGQNKLFKWLRDNRYLGSVGERYNVPNQRYIEQGLFTIKKGVRSGNGGVLKTTITTKVTGKGQSYFINKFLNKKCKSD